MEKSVNNATTEFSCPYERCSLYEQKVARPTGISEYDEGGYPICEECGENLSVIGPVVHTIPDTRLCEPVKVGESEVVDIYRCPACHGLFGVDASYIANTDEDYHCAMCGATIRIAQAGADLTTALEGRTMTQESTERSRRNALNDLLHTASTLQSIQQRDPQEAIRILMEAAELTEENNPAGSDIAAVLLDGAREWLVFYFDQLLELTE
jgi:hypothetical protein